MVTRERLGNYRIYDESSKDKQRDNIPQLSLDFIKSVANFSTVHLAAESIYKVLSNYHCNAQQQQLLLQVLHPLKRPQRLGQSTKGNCITPNTLSKPKSLAKLLRSQINFTSIKTDFTSSVLLT